MTLLIVDHHHIVADSYATQFDGQDTQVFDDFPKIHTLPLRLEFTYTGERLISHNHLAFCGDANTFMAIWEEVVAHPPRTVDELVDIVSRWMGDIQLVIPFPAAVVVITSTDTGFDVTYREGEVFAFGDGYVGEDPYNESRAWFTILQESITAGRLPGNQFHQAYHQSTCEIVHGEFIMIDMAKLRRRRTPWNKTQVKR